MVPMVHRLMMAIMAFYRALGQTPCRHPQVHRHGQTNYCPDCGQRIRFVWALIQCIGCHQYRRPQLTWDGAILPKELHCRCCGSDKHRLVKRRRLDSALVQRAVSVRDIDEGDPDDGWPPRGKGTRNNGAGKSYDGPNNTVPFPQVSVRNPYGTNPFSGFAPQTNNSSHIVEGEVVGYSVVG